MKKLKNTLGLIAATLLFVCSCGHHDNQHHAHRGVYHWKTTYNPTNWEKQWMKDHKVDRLYIKLFDVDAGYKNGYLDYSMVPVATTRFVQDLPDGLEVVPVVYITVDAIRGLKAKNQWNTPYDYYADILIERITKMMQQNGKPQFQEVQLDCDWTQQTKETYFRLCIAVGKVLHSRGKTLSGTLRLHQLREVEQPAKVHYGWRDTIPFDRSLLMCYNTGHLQDPKTKNSILDFDDVLPYLKQYHSSNLPRTDVAYPIYGWGVEFHKDGGFKKIVSSHSLNREKESLDVENTVIREEWGEPEDILQTQASIPTLDTCHTVILYHLDSLNLSRYSYEDIENFYSR